MADYSGGGSSSSAGAVVLVSSTVLAATAATIDFPGIAQTFSHLRVVVNARSDNPVGAGVVQLRLNNDSSALYDALSSNSIGSGAMTVTGVAAGTSARICAMPFTGLALASAPIEFLIPDYTRTTFYKTWAGFGGRKDADALNNFTVETPWGSYRSQNAVTQVTLLSRGTSGTAQNFVPGSGAWLYGIS